jgi:hypothetical protein
MRTWILRAALVVPFVGLAFSSPARAWSDEPCSAGNSILQGDYAFTVSGQVFMPSGTIERQGIALTHFEGNGKFTQVDFVLASPLPAGAPTPPKGQTDMVSGFTINESGTYTVNPDCTGEFTITDAGYTNSAGAPVSDGVIKVKFILSDHGRAIHTMVYSLQPPGAPGPVPVLIHSDGHKLGKVED